MAFTVEDFQDLIRLLEQREDWRQELRRLILTEKLLELPDQVAALTREVRALAQAQRQTEEQVRQLVEAQRRTDEEVRQLAGAQRRTEEQVRQLTEAQRRTEEEVRQLAEAQRRHYEEFAAHRQEFLAYRAETDRRLAELTEAQRKTEEEVRQLSEQVRQLTEAQRRTEEQIRQLTEAQRKTEETVRTLIHQVRDLREQFRGRTYEEHDRTHLRRYRYLVQEPRVLTGEEVSALLLAAEVAGQLTEEEADDLELADVIVRGRSLEGEGERVLVVEVSATVHWGDVERAARRAAALRKALPGAEVLAVVAGPALHPQAARAARARGVWWLRNGRAVPPEAIPSQGEQTD